VGGDFARRRGGGKKVIYFYLSVTLLNDRACKRDFGGIKAIEVRNDFDIVG